MPITLPADSINIAEAALLRQDVLLKSFGDNSKELSSTALLILGGSILLILSTDYISPPSRKARFMYLLFIPAWYCLCVTIYYNNRITRSDAAYLYTSNKETKTTILENVNQFYISQLTHFQLGVFLLALWLVLYLFWWIMYAELKPKK
jgi:carbon starvation protein CstA